MRKEIRVYSSNFNDDADNGKGLDTQGRHNKCSPRTIARYNMENSKVIVAIHPTVDGVITVLSTTHSLLEGV